MDSGDPPLWPRREFLRGVSAAAGGLLGLGSGHAAAEPPPEIDTLRIPFYTFASSLCLGPQYVAEQFLRLEGFERIHYVPGEWVDSGEGIARGEVDLAGDYIGQLLMAADRYDSVVVVSGMHVGCAEVFGGERVRSFGDLAGKRIAYYAPGDVVQVFMSMMLAYIGIDPRDGVEWVALPVERWPDALEQGEVDALLLWPPALQTYRKNNIGKSVWKMNTDRPWRQYFCCMVAASRELTERYPVAAKRAVRAMLKAIDLCASAPERAARAITDLGFPVPYEQVVESLRYVPWAEWRDYDPADALRFHALRLHELGMIDSTPAALVAKCADWRFLDEIKRELKA